MSELEGEIDSGHVGGYRYGTALTNIKSVRSLRSPFATIKDAKKKRKTRKKSRRRKRKTKRRNKKRKTRRRKSYRKRK